MSHIHAAVKPLTSLLEERPLKLRSDVVAPDIPPEQVLRNAKETEEGYFAVPKIREEFNQ
jgi:aspartyl/glutamyl-tRNA(Asn/Gln) amidotransferase C subunit